MYPNVYVLQSPKATCNLLLTISYYQLTKTQTLACAQIGRIIQIPVCL